MLRDDLPGAAEDGIDDVNDAFEDIDVGGVQDAVGDIAWEFDRGISDAATEGVGKVNASMDTAEQALEDVRSKGQAISGVIRYDIPDATGIAGYAIGWFAKGAIEDFVDVQDAAEELAGQSPSGIELITYSLQDAQAALRAFRQTAIPAFAAVESAAAAASWTGGGAAGLASGGAGLAPASSRGQTVNIYLDGSVLARSVLQHAPTLLEVVAGA
jgi:hypothetical protein